MGRHSLYYILSDRLAAPPPGEGAAAPGSDLLTLVAHGGYQPVALNAFAWRIGTLGWSTPSGLPVGVG